MTKRIIYKSKVGAGLLLFVLIVFAFGTYWLLLDWNWVGGTIHFGTLILVLYLFYSISYEFKEKDLLINYGVFYQKKIKITSIQSIKETRNPISSPAASLDRLELGYKDGIILVSPKDKAGFIAHIKTEVPDVKVEMRC